MMAIHPDRTILGMEIIVPDPPQPWALIVQSERRQPEWRVYSDRLEDKLDPQAAPTTIYYWDEPYRIEREIQDEHGWTYFMRPWPDHAAIFHRFELSNAYIEGRKLERQELKNELRKAEVSIFYDFLVGFLPARQQHQLSVTMGFDPVEATRHSAMLCFYLGVFLPIGAFFGGLHPLLCALLLVIVGVVDGLGRWAWVITDEHVSGLIILEFLDWFPGWLMKKLVG